MPILLNNLKIKSIRNKLIFFMTIVVVVTSLFNICFYYITYNSMDKYNELLVDYTDINNLSIKLIEGRDVLSLYMSPDSEFGNDKRQLLKYNLLISESEILTDKILSRCKSLDSYLLAKSIKNSFGTYKETVNNMLNYTANYKQFPFIKNYTVYIENYIKQLLNIKLNEGSWYHKKISSNTQNIKLVNFFGVVFIALLSLAYIIILSNSITIPIKKLTQFARSISHGDFSNRQLVLNSSEDINILAATLNKMSQNLDQMMTMEKKLHEEEILRFKMSTELNNAKYLSLQSQINPHFLFNTLNAISRYAMFENANYTITLIDALSSIFRYNLKGMDKDVLLNEELDIIKKYALIQNARFGDK
jgi:two-component system, sensor histidine kinase YesM